MNSITKYGWLFLLLAMIGDLLIPFILAPFYSGYSNTQLTISALGNTNSPVRFPFNIWMLIEGVFFLISLPSLFNYFKSYSITLTILMVIFIAIFSIGACIFTTFFSVNESKDIISISSIIHGYGSVIGFMLFLFVPLILALLQFKQGYKLDGVISVFCFILGLLFFTLFVMSDKTEFKGTIIAKEGLWQRLNLLFMYIPLIFLSIKQLLYSGK